MSDEWQTQALRWLAFALGDLRAARSRRGEWRPARIAAFHAQQAAEKAVKAGLLLSRIEPPRTHDLEILLPLLPDNWRAKRSRRNLGRLTDYAADARYPDDIQPVAQLRPRLPCDRQ